MGLVIPEILRCADSENPDEVRSAYARLNGQLNSNHFFEICRNASRLIAPLCKIFHVFGETEDRIINEFHNQKLTNCSRAVEPSR